MRVSRLYYEGDLAQQKSVTLDRKTTHYLKNVLRVRVGHQLIVFTGDNLEYTCSLDELGKHALLTVQSSVNSNRESALACTLIQGISKGDHMDYCLQKSAELGIKKITPVICERTVVHLDDERQQRRLDRWMNIIISACEQCGRNELPVLEPITTFTDLVSRQTASSAFLLDAHAENTLTTIIQPGGDIDLLCGPEGGLSDNEKTIAIKAGYTAIKLGPRTLRTETAAIACLAAMQVLWGDCS